MGVPYYRRVALGDVSKVIWPAMESCRFHPKASGGELPEFDTIDAANELIGALVMGLWNRLTRHQDRGVPFWLNAHQHPRATSDVSGDADVEPVLH